MAATDIFVALANPVRRRILELLLDGPSTVNGLVEQFDLRRPAVSEHLQVLRTAKLVKDQKRGRERYYSIEPLGLGEIQGWLEPFERYWRRRLAALDESLNEEKT